MNNKLAVIDPMTDAWDQIGLHTKGFFSEATHANRVQPE
jgi:hypothetical protein